MQVTKEQWEKEVNKMNSDELFFHCIYLGFDRDSVVGWTDLKRRKQIINNTR